jgi:hypothetical protein
VDAQRMEQGAPSKSSVLRVSAAVNFGELREGEVRRISLLSTPVNRVRHIAPGMKSIAGSCLSASMSVWDAKPCSWITTPKS